MNRRLINILLVFALSLLGVACNDDEPTIKEENTKTLLMYMPWTGSSSALTEFFWTNISDMQTAYKLYGNDTENVIVFICTSANKAVMFNIKDYTGHTNTDLQQYTQISKPDFTSTDGIAKILGDMQRMAPAKSYAMTVGCHGMGWIPVNASSSAKRRIRGATDFKYHWEWNNADGAVTRFFGGSSAEYQTDITTFASAIAATGTKMEFILFDDCYMSSIEVAYDLRGVADYLIACPTEVMGAGMPYANLGRYLLGTTDYKKVCSTFYDYYSTYTINGTLYNYGTIGVTKLSELDQLASIEKRINSLYTFDASLTDSLQRMDGYRPTIFFDYGDYVSKLCTDSTLLAEFNEQLDKAVPYKAHTLKYYSTYYSGQTIPINTYSGITTSAPSINSQASDWENTSWYKATH